VFVRSSEVPDILWNALERNITPGSPRHNRSEEVRVPLERFLASRNWLASSLTRHGCSVEFDDQLLAVLGRADAERNEVTRLLSGIERKQGVGEPDNLLVGSRFHGELKPFQQRDLVHLLSLSHGANFSVPGAGKTAVEYAIYEAERMRGRVERLLVVAPLSAFEAWVDEAKKWLNPSPMVCRLSDRVPVNCEVVLVNYQRLAPRFEQVAEWVARRPCLVVLDEAHRMKRGRSGEWGSACLDLAHLAVRRDILTGTPAPQHPSDFVALLDFVWPQQGVRIIPAQAMKPDPPDGVMVEVSQRLAPLFARTKKDELGLEEPVRRVELVKMKPLQAKIYEALRTRMRYAIASSAMERAALAHVGEVLMYLLEAASNPSLLAKAVASGPGATTTWPPLPVPANSTLGQLIRDYSAHEVPRKFEKLAAMVADNASRDLKTLVWSNFVGTLQELAERVLAPHNPALIYGGVPSGSEDSEYVTREQELRRFRQDRECKVLIANPASMGEGVSLHDACHDAIYVDRTFNAGQYLQSVDRIHRLGLEPGTETRITFLLSTDTVDELVDQRVRLKAERLSQMLSDPNLVTMALPDEEAYGEWVDAEDVEALFEHLRVDG
jgi:SNF2 family DNA or RNA helicase